MPVATAPRDTQRDDDPDKARPRRPGALGWGAAPQVPATSQGGGALLGAPAYLRVHAAGHRHVAVAGSLSPPTKRHRARRAHLPGAAPATGQRPAAGPRSVRGTSGAGSVPASSTHRTCYRVPHAPEVLSRHPRAGSGPSSLRKCPSIPQEPEVPAGHRARCSLLVNQEREGAAAPH